MPPRPSPAAELSLASLRRAAEAWAAQDPEPTCRAQIAAWLATNDERALRGAFSGRLAFGTAGLRAQVGAGPTRMNALVVRQTVRGLLEVLAADSPHRGTIAIGFDGRLDSERFAKQAIGVAMAAGFAVEAFAEPVPTPLVGFWVKERSLLAGVVITASHNPPADNGLKVYWRGGVQIAAPIDAAIARAIEQVAASEQPVAYRPPRAADAVTDVTSAASEAYVAALAKQVPWPKQQTASSPVPLLISYSPLHGVGAALSVKALSDCGGVKLHVVASQQVPNGHFPGVSSPNPEDTVNFAEALMLGERLGADIACLHDPDADRLAVAARWPWSSSGAPPAAPSPAVHRHAPPPTELAAVGALQAMRGDELGIALAHLLLAEHPSKNSTAVACSLVSSQLLPMLARHHGARFDVTLPGFKWLARAAMAAAAEGLTCLLAYEEALGYAPTSLVWDKDGVATLRLVARLALACKQRGHSLWHALAQAQAVTALSVTAQRTVALHAAHASEAMALLRGMPAAPFGPFHLQRIEDGLAPAFDSPLQGLPPSNWLAQFYQRPQQTTEGLAAAAEIRVILRPSGTEPKLKLYYEHLAAPVPVSRWPAARQALQRTLTTFVEAHCQATLAALSSQASPPRPARAPRS